MKDYKKLKVWEKSHELTLLVYASVLSTLPDHEKYDLGSQIKRAAYSIPMNIAEGCGKHTEKDFARYLDNALGSSHELEYCCLLAKDLNYLNAEKFNEVNRRTNEVKAMLIGLIKSLR